MWQVYGSVGRSMFQSCLEYCRMEEPYILFALELQVLLVALVHIGKDLIKHYHAFMGRSGKQPYLLSDDYVR